MPTQLQSQAVVCVNTPRMYLQSEYFLVTTYNIHSENGKKAFMAKINCWWLYDKKSAVSAHQGSANLIWHQRFHEYQNQSDNILDLLTRNELNSGLSSPIKSALLLLSYFCWNFAKFSFSSYYVTCSAGCYTLECSFLLLQNLKVK